MQFLTRLEASARNVCAQLMHTNAGRFSVAQLAGPPPQSAHFVLVYIARSSCMHALCVASTSAFGYELPSLDRLISAIAMDAVCVRANGMLRAHAMLAFCMAVHIAGTAMLRIAV